MTPARGQSDQYVFGRKPKLSTCQFLRCASQRTPGHHTVFMLSELVMPTAAMLLHIAMFVFLPIVAATAPGKVDAGALDDAAVLLGGPALGVATVQVVVIEVGKAVHPEYVLQGDGHRGPAVSTRDWRHPAVIVAVPLLVLFFFLFLLIIIPTTAAPGRVTIMILLLMISATADLMHEEPVKVHGLLQQGKDPANATERRHPRGVHGVFAHVLVLLSPELGAPVPSLPLVILSRRLVCFTVL